MSRGVKIIAGIVLIVVGSIYDRTGIVTSIGAGLVSSGMTKPPKTPRYSPAAIRANSAGGITIIPLVFGKARVGGKDLVPVKTTDDDADGSKENLHRAIAHSLSHTGGIEALGDIYLDNELILSSEIDGSGNVTKAKYVDADANTMVNIRSYLGTDAQTVDTVLEAAFTDWGTNHRLKGIAYTALTLIRPTGEANEKKFQKAFKNGQPREISRMVEGCKCYDVRLDSTRGGSGAHRTSDPSTWEWSDNPFVVGSTYLIMDQKDFGLGADPDVDISQAGWDTFAAAATVCDVTFTDPDAGSIKKYTFNGVLASEDPDDNLDMIAASAAGLINYDILAGTWKGYAGTISASVATIDETWLRDGPVEKTTKKEIGGLYNAVKCNFISPDLEYKETTCQLRTNSSYETADGGRQIVREIDVPGIDNEYRAQYRAAIELKRSREQGIVKLSCNMKALDLIWWDIVTLDLPDATGTFRVKSFEWVDGFPDLILEQANSDTYDTGTETSYTATTAPALSASPPPTPSNLALSITPEGARIKVDDLGNSAISHYEFERAADSSGSPGAVEDNVNFVDATTLDTLSDTNIRHYRVRAINENGEASSYTGWLNVTPAPAETGATENQITHDADDPSPQSGDIRVDSATDDQTTYHNGSSYVLGGGSVVGENIFVGTTVQNAIDLLNAQITVNADGSLTNAGAGSPDAVSIANAVSQSGGLAYTGPADATNNNYYNQASPPAGDSGDKWTDSDNAFPYDHNGSSWILANGADWASSLQSRPTELTDGRLLAGIDASGDLNRDMLVARRNSSSLLGYLGGAEYTGALAAQVNAPSIGAKKNYDSFSNPNAGEFYIHGFDDSGSPTDVDGFIQLNGAKLTVTKGAVWTGGTVSGYIVFESAGGGPFIHGGSQDDAALAYKVNDQWTYDKNGTPTDFTDTTTMVVIGTVDITSADVIGDVQIWSAGMSLNVVAEAGSTVGSKLGLNHKDESGTVINDEDELNQYTAPGINEVVDPNFNYTLGKAWTTNDATDVTIDATGDSNGQSALKIVGNTSSNYANSGYIPVKKGEKFYQYLKFYKDAAFVSTSVHGFRVQIITYDKDKAVLGSLNAVLSLGSASSYPLSTWHEVEVPYSLLTTAPHDDVQFVRFSLYCTTQVTAGYAKVEYFRASKTEEQADITSTMANLNNLAVGGVTSAFSVLPVPDSTDAGATATINISASTLNLGLTSVSYNSGSITGKAFSTVYYIYADDAGYVGGAVTYIATTTPLTLAQQEGRVFFGGITTVADGGGGGGPTPPEEWCVSVEMFLTQEYKAIDSKAGLLIDVLGGPDHYQKYGIESVEFSEVECVQLVTISGAELICSTTTPLTLKDGSTILVPESLGEEAAVVIDEVLSWEPIISVQHVGIHQVAHIHVGGRTYAAGKNAEKRIFTHNPIKP